MAFTHYKLLTAHKKHLAAEVMAAIGDGWQPLGGPVPDRSEPDVFTQAVTKGAVPGAALEDHDHAIEADAASGLTAAETLQEAFVALSARVKLLEDAAG